MSQIIDRLRKESAFAQLKEDPSVSEEHECLVHVTKVRYPIGREDYDVVQVDQTSIPLNTGQDDVNRPLEGSWRIAKAERQTKETVYPIV